MGLIDYEPGIYSTVVKLKWRGQPRDLVEALAVLDLDGAFKDARSFEVRAGGDIRIHLTVESGKTFKDFSTRQANWQMMLDLLYEKKAA